MSSLARLGPRRRQHGQALVEFSLVIPVFLLLLFGIIDFGRFVYTANGLNQAAREAARVGSVSIRTECSGTRDACIAQIARSRVPGIIGTITLPAAANGEAFTAGNYGCFRLGAAGGTPTSVGVNNCRSGDLLRVGLRNQFALVTPLIAQFIGNLTIRGEAVVTVNQ